MDVVYPKRKATAESHRSGKKKDDKASEEGKREGKVIREKGFMG